MDENQNEEEVLLVADKDDGGKLKAVDKSAAREGIFRMLLPSMENMDDFVRVSSQSTILEDFFRNLHRQYDRPTDFRFYHIPAALFGTLDVFTDMLRNPEDNKDFIAQYEVNPDDYAKQLPEQQTANGETVSEQTATTEQTGAEQQSAQPVGIENRIDWEQLARLGVTRESLEQSGDL